MRFKRIALFFILFANTLLLAHSVVPHHHHKGLVVNLNTPLSKDNNNQKINDHSHDNGDDADCVLKQEILIQGRSFRSAIDQQNEASVLNLIQDINNSIPILANPIYYSLCSSSRIHFDLSQYLFLLNNSQGLRAPPLS